MNIKPLDRKVSASGQISHVDFARIGAAGIKGIICNRPDGEEAGQPEFAALKAHADRLGLKMIYIPYAYETITPRLLGRLNHAIDTVDGPVLLYCRSGQRSEELWRAARGPRRLAA
jgi:sulfide:quinone oxidoreductase